MDKETYMGWLKDRLDDDDYGTASEFLESTFREMDEYRDSASARYQEFEQTESALKKEIGELKARNYDLLMQVPRDGGSGAIKTDNAEPEIITIDDLFS